MALPRLRRFGGQQQEFQCGLYFPIPNIFGKFWNILPGAQQVPRGDDGYRRKCCGYIYYVKLVTNAAANQFLIGDGRTAAFGQKENMGKGEYGKGTFRADQFCILGTYGQWLGMNVLLRLNDDWLFVPYEWSQHRIACAYAECIQMKICLIHLLSRNHPR